MSIRCGHCGGHHPSVAGVRECGQAANSKPWTLATPVARPGPATVGLYRKGGQIYAVDYWGGSGRLVARRLDRYVLDGQTCYRMVATPGQVKRLTQADRMDSEEAAAFGKITGVCVRCARRLTHPDSVAAGIGPVCAKKI